MASRTGYGNAVIEWLRTSTSVIDLNEFTHLEFIPRSINPIPGAFTARAEVAGLRFRS